MLDALISKTKRGILELLFRHPDESFYRNEIIRKMDGGRNPVVRALASLVDAGILVAERRGREVFYSPNKAAPLYEDILSIITKTGGIADVIRNALKTLPGIKLAFIYGSIAKGSQRRASDIDLMMVVDSSFAGLDLSLMEPHLILKREINPVIIDVDELRERFKQNDGFIAGVLNGKKIFVIGDDDELRSLVG